MDTVAVAPILFSPFIYWSVAIRVCQRVRLMLTWMNVYALRGYSVGGSGNWPG